MTASQARTIPDARAAIERPSYRGSLLALVVAVLALFAVMATLIIEGRRTRAVREEIIVTLEPARNQLYDLQRLLALQEAEQRGGAPPPELRRSLPVRASVEQRIDSVLNPLHHHAQRAGPGAIAAYAELRAHVGRWQTNLANLEQTPTSAALRAVVRAEYASVLRSADRLHRALNQEIVRRRERVRDLERLEVWLVGAIILLALCAILVMARIARQQAVLVEQIRRLAVEAEEGRQDVERVSEEKARFVRGVTHDLKNPLGAIDAYAQLLESDIKGSLGNEQRHYVGRIRNAVQQLLGTIQDLLELARAETRGLRIERRATDMAALVRGAVEDYRAAFEAGGLRVDLEIPTDLSRIPTDPRRVTEILGNLLSNASKYTPEGGRVWVRARYEAGDESNGSLVLEVQDTGPGIPEGAQERIFQEFQRVAGHQVEGAGVGLSISRRFARLMGGDLTVRSRPGKGATFLLSLPVRAGAESPTARRG